MHQALSTAAAAVDALATPLPVAGLPAPTTSVISVAGAQQNALLRALSRDDLARLFDRLELVCLPVGKHLFDFGDKIEHSYFPTNAIVSLLYVMTDGATTEIAVIGREGVVGVALYEAERVTCSAIVQGAGYGYRLKTEFVRELFHEGGALAQLLMRYSGALFAQMAQNVVGGRHCTIEQKLCRWLLDRLDRSLSNELKVTQDAMANMLGVRRESVTVTARKLQDEGLIQYRRGTVVVLDRARLELCAGACYRAARAGLDQMQRHAGAN